VVAAQHVPVPARDQPDDAELARCIGGADGGRARDHGHQAHLLDPAPDAAIGEADDEYAFGAPTGVIQSFDEAGIIQSVDDRGLVRIARDADIVLEMAAPIGDPISPGMPLFRVYGAGDDDGEQLERSVAIGDERTMRQDPAFALRLLADIPARVSLPAQ